MEEKLTLLEKQLILYSKREGFNSVYRINDLIKIYSIVNNIEEIFVTIDYVYQRCCELAVKLFCKNQMLVLFKDIFAYEDLISKTTVIFSILSELKWLDITNDKGEIILDLGKPIF